MRKSRVMKSRKGFTLLELVAVIGILAVLAAVAIPQYSKSVERGRRAAAETWLSSMLTAYGVALSHGAAGVALPPSAATWPYTLGDTTIGAPPKGFDYTNRTSLDPEGIALARNSTSIAAPTGMSDYAVILSTGGASGCYDKTYAAKDGGNCASF